jgi:hypothetical protein
MSGETLRARTELLERIERAAAGGVSLAAATTTEDVKSGPVHPLAATFDVSEGGAHARSGTRARPTPDRAPLFMDLAGEGRALAPTQRSQTPLTPSSPPFVPITSDAPPRPHFNLEPRPSSDSFGGARQSTAPSSAPPRAHFNVEPRPISDGYSGVRQPTPDAAPRPPVSDGHGEVRQPTADPPSRPSVAPRAVADGQGGALQSSNPLATPPPAARPRRVPIPIPVDQERHISLRERLETPFKVVAAGVVLSLVDAAARPYLGDFPVRPLWLAEILVVVGVLWALARMVLPLRTSRD